MKKLLIVLLIFALLVPIAMAKQDENVENRNDASHYRGREIVPGDVIVKYRGEVKAPLVNDAHMKEQLVDKVFLFHSDKKDADALISDLSLDPDVEYAEPNYIVYAQATPNDPSYNLLYGMPKIGAPQAWDLTTGTDTVVVAVIDTGIRYTHPDLVDNVWSAPTAFTVTINGYPLTCPAGSHGYNAPANTCDPMDDNYHGTHCSGTIGAIGNNGVGVAGVNWNTKIIGVKFLGSTGSGYTSDAIKALEFLIQTKQYFGDKANIRVVSNSWGGAGFSQALLDEINKAGDNGMLFVAAAGNSNTDADLVPFYPADYNTPYKMAVAATDNNDLRATFSSWGKENVSMGAPGVNVYSTYVTAATGAPTYAYLSGTSMATPHVAGAAALALSKCDLNTLDLKAALTNNVDLIPSMAGKTISGGRLNVSKTIIACMITNPLPPTPTPTPTPVPPDIQLAGNGGYPVGGPYAYAWTITSGTVSGNQIHLAMDYTRGASCKMTMEGTIAQAGTMSGTWSDNCGGTRTSTWIGTGGNAGRVTGAWKFNYLWLGTHYVHDAFLTEPVVSAGFTATSSGATAYFTDSSTNAKAWLWDFGDGITTTEQNPVHTYAALGQYTVSLTITNGDTESRFTRKNYIRVV